MEEKTKWQTLVWKRSNFERIQKKLAKQDPFKLSQETGIPLYVLGAIAEGWEPEFRHRGRPFSSQKLELPQVETLDKETLLRQPQRCPGCGARLVRLPCRKCQLESQPRAKRFENISYGTQHYVEISDGIHLGLSLSPDCYSRYVKLREQKMQEELERNARETAEEWERSQQPW